MIPGLVARGDAGGEPSWIEADPAMALMIKNASPQVAAAIAQWSAGGDPDVILDSIMRYASSVASDFDLVPTDFARNHTDARSGYAITVSREGQRNAQRRYTPQFERGDRQMLEIVAALWRGETGEALPETGWSVHYRGLPLSIEERTTRAELLAAEVELGTKTVVQAKALIEQITEEQARERLRIEADDRRMFASA
jgi:hypothetical protein